MEKNIIKVSLSQYITMQIVALGLKVLDGLAIGAGIAIAFKYIGV